MNKYDIEQAAIHLGIRKSALEKKEKGVNLEELGKKDPRLIFRDYGEEQVLELKDEKYKDLEDGLIGLGYMDEVFYIADLNEGGSGVIEDPISPVKSQAYLLIDEGVVNNLTKIVDLLVEMSDIRLKNL